MTNLRIDYPNWPCTDEDVCLFLLTDDRYLKSSVSVPYNALAGTIRELKERLKSRNCDFSISCYANNVDITHDYSQEWYPVVASSELENHLVDKLLESWTDLCVR